MTDNINEWFSLLGNEIVLAAQELKDKTDRMRAEGKTVYPPSDKVFAALSAVSPSNVKSVILGQDPYHEPNQAMGLSFSVPEGVKKPRSLNNIFKELEADLGYPAPESGDLTPWANRGVLLLNTVLTVEEHKANSHKKLGWDRVTNGIIRLCLTLPQPVVFICWGMQAKNLVEKNISDCGDLYSPETKAVLASTHPSPLSANKKNTSLPPFFGSKPFGKTNELLQKMGAEPINWKL